MVSLFCKQHNYLTSGLLGVILTLALVGVSEWRSVYAVDAGESDTTNAIYLPIVTVGKAEAQPIATPTFTATPTTASTATPTTTPTVKPTVTTIPSTLPHQLVATWYSGNAPLNDFYNPQTGEWRDVNGLGQMIVFANDGAYTYTGFLRLQVGACRSEVSTYKQGTAAVSGNALTLTPTLVKTRSLMICGNTQETITDGPYDPIIQPWTFVDGDDGHEQLTIGTASEATTYYKAGMVQSLAGVWQSDDLGPIGFYSPATTTFDLESSEGMWFDFGLDGRYRYGERNHGTADDEGCFNQWWIYQEGTYTVVGGRLSMTPQTGMLRQQNSCPPYEAVQNPWLDDARDYTWFYRDRNADIKLVIIPLSPFIEFVFERP